MNANANANDHGKVPVFFYKDKFLAASERMTGQELNNLFSVIDGRDLYLVNGDKDIKIISTELYEIKPGSHFEDAPAVSGGNGDSTPIPSLLQMHLDELVSYYGLYKAYRINGSIIVEFPTFPLPVGVFAKDFSSLKVVVPTPYPQGILDMVWLEPNLGLLRGTSQFVVQQPFADNEIRTRISCHVVSNGWQPGKDNIKTFLRSIMIFLEGLRAA